MNGLPLPPLQTLTTDNAHQLREILRIGNGDPRTVAYSPDGRYLAVGTTVGIWLYHPTTHEKIRLIAPNENSDCIAFSSDSEFIASPGKARSIHVWKVDTGEKIASFDHDNDNDHLFVNSLSFDPTQSIIASGDWHSVNLWNYRTGEPISSIPDVGNVSCVRFSPDGRYLGISNSHGESYVWNMENNTLSTLPAFPTTRGAMRIAFYDNRTIFYGCNHIISLWDLITATEVKRLTFDSSRGLLKGLEYGVKTQILISAYWAGGVYTYNLNSGESQVVDSTSTMSISLYPDETKLSHIAHSINDAVDIYDLVTQDRQSLHVHESLSGGLAIHPTSNHLAFGERWNVIRILDLGKSDNSKKLDIRARGLEDISNQCVFTSDGNMLIIAGAGACSELYTWNLQSDTIRQWERDDDPVGSPVEAMLFHPDNNLLCTSYDRLRLWDFTQSDSPIAISTPHLEHIGIINIAINKAGELAIVGSWIDEHNKNAWGITFVDLKSLAIRSQHQLTALSPPKCVTINPESTLLAGGGSRRHTSVAWLMDIETDTILFSFDTGTYHGATFNRVTFNPDGSLVAYSDSLGDIYLWDVEKRTQITVLRHHVYHLEHIIFSPDGKFIASIGNMDGTLRLWGVPK